MLPTHWPNQFPLVDRDIPLGNQIQQVVFKFRVLETRIVLANLGKYTTIFVVTTKNWVFYLRLVWLLKQLVSTTVSRSWCWIPLKVSGNFGDELLGTHGFKLTLQRLSELRQSRRCLACSTVVFLRYQKLKRTLLKILGPHSRFPTVL